MQSARISRRQLIAGAASGVIGRAFAAVPPASPVAIARCATYDQEMFRTLGGLMNQIGGIEGLVKGRTVAVKLNLTGNVERYPEHPEMPYRNHPATVLALAQLLSNAGAQRIRIIEAFFPASQELELWARYGLDVKAISNVGCKVEWENTQNLGQAKQYKRLKVPSGGYIFPAFDLNHSFTDCDVYVSLSKLKQHATAGVTMAMKNNFGNTPCSLYGGDCGESGNENPTQERGPVCHNGSRTPPKGVPQELDRNTPREGGYRVPRIVVDAVGARPIDLAIVDGIESIKSGWRGKTRCAWMQCRRRLWAATRLRTAGRASSLIATTPLNWRRPRASARGTYRASNCRGSRSKRYFSTTARGRSQRLRSGEARLLRRNLDGKVDSL